MSLRSVQNDDLLRDTNMFFCSRGRVCEGRLRVCDSWRLLAGRFSVSGQHANRRTSVEKFHPGVCVDAWRRFVFYCVERKNDTASPLNRGSRRTT
ncbi:hypothetical protein AMELA_G00042960 [Ameiurus melas]|uniref:Uncharacterized protein n=1 Tax=Ameiurus melas TaxID=219545 RepID=A0A7J6B3Z8_AMEME|nr:hypothetical protein AMELA_G00042960 [Ameiurus melas]